MKNTCDIEEVLLELAARMTVEELVKWKETIPVIAKEKGFDPNGQMAMMFKDIIDTTIEDKQTRQVNGGRKLSLPPAR